VIHGGRRARADREDRAHHPDRPDRRVHGRPHASNSQPNRIALGPDGNLWFTEFSDPGRIGRITTAGAIDEFAIPSQNSGPLGIVTGCDGNLWFTESANPGRIGRITPAGAATEFTSGLTPNSMPVGIAADPDGNVWFTQFANPGRVSKIGAGCVPSPAPPQPVATQPTFTG
jgi:streptogramin lyase